MSVKNVQIANSIKKILQEQAEDYRNTCAESRLEKMQGMTAGEPAPAEGVLYAGRYADSFKTRCDGRRNAVYKILEDSKRDFIAAAVAPPKPEAVATLQLMAIRSNVTQAEIDGLCDLYGDNSQTLRAINDIAQKNKLAPRYGSTPDPADTLESIATLQNHFGYDFTPKGSANLTPGKLAIYGMQIDETFPEG